MKVEYINGQKIITHDSGVVTTYTSQDYENALVYSRRTQTRLSEKIVWIQDEIQLIDNSVIKPDSL